MAQFHCFFLVGPTLPHFVFVILKGEKAIASEGEKPNFGHTRRGEKKETQMHRAQRAKERNEA